MSELYILWALYLPAPIQNFYLLILNFTICLTEQCNNTALCKVRFSNTMHELPWNTVLSWEGNSCSASHEIPLVLRNKKVHYCVHKSLPLIPILSQLNLVSRFATYFIMNHSGTILIYTSRSSERSLPFRFSDQNFVCIFSPMHATSLTHLTLPDLITLIIVCEEYSHEVFHYTILSSLTSLPPSPQHRSQTCA